MSSICRMRQLLRPSSLCRALSSSAHYNLQTRSSNDSIVFQTSAVSKALISQVRFKSALPDISDEGTCNLTPFLMADIGEGIAEVELLQWYITPGAHIHQFDRVCQVQSDKASVEITSRYDGIVRQLCCEVGEVVKVGEPLCFLETENSGEVTLHNVNDEERLSVPSVASDYSSVYEEVADAPEISANTDESRFSSGPSSKVLSSPAVRKLGKEHGIDISKIKGSGPNGRVLKSDVLKLIQPAGAAESGTTTSAVASATPSTAPIIPQEDEVIPIRGYHRLMVKSMTSSLSVPHMVYTDEIDVTSLQELRSQLKPTCAERGIKLTLLPFFLKAASLALKQYPVVNGSIDMEKMELVVHRRHDLGVAVDTSKGLVVVVVRGCEKKSVEEIAVELGRLFALAAEGNLTEDDISNPTFTLSNIGAIGGTYMSPVVLPPQVAIGAMGKIQRLPRFVNDSSNEVKAVQVMPISWGGDHRAIDGATMARFSNAWKYFVENPHAMMFEMR